MSILLKLEDFHYNSNSHTGFFLKNVGFFILMGPLCCFINFQSSFKSYLRQKLLYLPIIIMASFLWYDHDSLLIWLKILKVFCVKWTIFFLSFKYKVKYSILHQKMYIILITNFLKSHQVFHSLFVVVVLFSLNKNWAKSYLYFRNTGSSST